MLDVAVLVDVGDGERLLGTAEYSVDGHIGGGHDEGVGSVAFSNSGRGHGEAIKVEALGRGAVEHDGQSFASVGGSAESEDAFAGGGAAVLKVDFVAWHRAVVFGDVALLNLAVAVCVLAAAHINF